MPMHGEPFQMIGSCGLDWAQLGCSIQLGVRLGCVELGLTTPMRVGMAYAKLGSAELKWGTPTSCSQHGVQTLLCQPHDPSSFCKSLETADEPESSCTTSNEDASARAIFEPRVFQPEPALFQAAGAAAA